MKTKRILSFIMSLVLMLSICGCGSDKTAHIMTEDDIVGQDGCFLYTIISAQGNNTIENADRETSNLKKQIAETFDIKVNSSIDNKVKADGEHYEILLGNTNRMESQKAMDTLKGNRIQNINDWMIKVIDKKICIVSVSDENLARAIRYFIENYCTKLSDFSKLNSKFEYIDMKSYPVQSVDDVKIGENHIAKYKIVTAREKSLLFSRKISQFVDLFKEDYGINIEEVTDEEKEKGDFEIIVGNTNRTLSLENKPKDGNYIVMLIGNQLVINGSDDVAIAVAFQKILDLEADSRDSGKPFTIPSDFKLEGTVQSNDNEYHYAWSDEFNGKLDKTIWMDQIGGPSSSPSPNGGTTYARGIQNVFTRDGCVVLPSKRLNDTDFESSSIQSHSAFAFRYGILEVRAKLAPPPMCSTIWGSLPTFQLKNGKRTVLPKIKNRQELDVLENFGQPDWFACNVHQWWTDGSQHKSLDGTKYAEQKKYYFPNGEAFYDDFHVFSVEWTPNGFSYSVDGNVYFKYDMSAMDNVGFAQTPVDLRFSGGFSSASYYLQKKISDDAPSYGEYLIDYIRVYQCDKYDNILWLSPVKN